MSENGDCVPCGLDPGVCRRKHIAAALSLEPNPRSHGDFEGDCPECRHGGFALSAPTRSKYRNIWACNCKRCNHGKGCAAGTVRLAMLRKELTAWCLGSYDGMAPGAVDLERARAEDQAISDILAVPHMRPADMRIILAEAQGRKIPEETSAFVKFAMSIGVGRRQAYEAAERWCRPSDLSSPIPGEGVVDTSRSTEPGSVVKPRSSQPRNRAVSAQKQGQGRAETAQNQIESRAVSAQTAQDRRPAA